MAEDLYQERIQAEVDRLNEEDKADADNKSNNKSNDYDHDDDEKKHTPVWSSSDFIKTDYINISREFGQVSCNPIFELLDITAPCCKTRLMTAVEIHSKI